MQASVLCRLCRLLAVCFFVFGSYLGKIDLFLSSILIQLNRNQLTADVEDRRTWVTELKIEEILHGADLFERPL